MKKKPTLGLGTLLAAVAIGAVLVAPGGAAKRTYSITCTSATITLTWPSGTTGADYEWFSSAGTLLGMGHSNISPKGAGSTTIDLDTTLGPAASASVTFTNKKMGAKLQPVACTA
jgi:hypothetical protein